ncbi:MAG: aldehyde dehydrogenase EutE [Thermoguttaceae bacterium]|nr:aldehyde dehydrogenase EutE [Thermoguttaceae bacterium]MDW8077375.1 aldehyde dehydrogenase EutE [Thermoguttaceae bacterium]
MQVTEALIRSVVEEVLQRLGADGRAVHAGVKSYQGRLGLFTDVNDAVAAAREAFELLSRRTLADRKRILDHIRRIAINQAEELGRMEFEETRIGRLPHKIEKMRVCGERIPGIEFLKSDVFSGDHGLTVIEYAPFGVIGVITPITHSLPTLTGNAINMIAAGNTLVVNPHPGGKRVAAEGVRRYNEAIYRDVGIDNLITIIVEPTLETARQIFNHPDVNLLCVTGGAGVVKAAMQTAKRAIVAGPGNPPVVVDETADLARAARSIIRGAAYDNNLLCIAEKQVFAVESIFDQLMAEMEKAGAVRLTSREIDRLTQLAITTVGEGADKHEVPVREFIGQDASVLAAAVGRAVPKETELLFGETDESNPFVRVEQMMPFIPFIRCRNVDEAIEAAYRSEHGFRHTAIIHSRNIDNITRMGKRMDTVLFVKNGPSLAGLGIGGEGYLSFSIAGPTGEGVTTPLTFTRPRHCVMVDNLRILGK